MLELYYDVLSASGLFQGMTPGELSAMLQCLTATGRRYQKGEVILLTGAKPEDVGIVLTGAVHILKEDYQGNRVLVAALGPSDLFAEALCCAEVSESPVSVVAHADSIVMRIGFLRILRVCSNACGFHTQLITNMLRLMARKNLFLQSRLDIISQPSVRSKVTTYLESFAVRQGRTVTIPLNREQMADYLCVERSALSHELMRMKRDGILDYRKNHFTLL